jgi:hypothetical protein
MWGEKGERGIDASGDTVIGTLTFELRSRSGGALGFKPERSVLVDKVGTRVEVKWVGGTVATPAPPR